MTAVVVVALVLTVLAQRWSSLRAAEREASLLAAVSAKERTIRQYSEWLRDARSDCDVLMLVIRKERAERSATAFAFGKPLRDDLPN